MKPTHWFTPLLLFSILANPLIGQNFFNPSDLTKAFSTEQEDNIEVSLVSEAETLVPGKTFWVATKLVVDEGWHLYWLNPGAAGAKPTIKWDLPEGFSAGDIHWPAPEKYVQKGLVSHTYHGTLYLMTPISAPETIEAESVELKAKVRYTICSIECKFGSKDVSLTLPVGEEETQNEEVSAAFASTREHWPKSGDALSAKAEYDDQQLVLEFTDQSTPATATIAAKDEKEKPTASLSLGILGFAFIGGAILNLMPCVFPVIGLKIMGFVTKAGEDKKTILMHGFAYTAGILISFWILAGVLLILRQGGTELGWGFQLQDPRFVFALCILLLVFALNLSGLFEIGTSLMGAGNNLSNKGGMQGSFFSGVLATVVSTPCAAPFLAPALGAALTLSASGSFTVFTVIALGLSAPYLLFSAFPKWIEKLPKPGPWMETFKQFMAFPLYATVVLLAWNLAAQVEPFHYLGILLSFVMIAFAGWMYGRWFRKGWAKITAGALLVICIVMPFPEAPPKPEPIAVQYDDLYFFPELPLTELPENQKYITVAAGQSFVQLPLAEYFDSEIESAKGRLRGILLLKNGEEERHLAIDAPLEQVKVAGKALAAAQKASGGKKAGKIPWETWSPEVEKQYLDAGKPVYIDFTARWCLTCQTNKLVALSSEKVANQFKEAGLVPLKADWTNRGPVIAKELAKYNRAAVPFNVIKFPNESDPIELPEVLTEGIVLNAVKKVEERMKKEEEPPAKP